MPRNDVSVKIPISPKLTKDQREVLADDIIDYIVDRTKSGKGKNNRRWSGSKANVYSDSYKNSLDFKQKRSKRSVNLELSGDMLTALEAKNKKGEITIQIPHGASEWARAKGNILGSYGKKPNSSKARNFLELGWSDMAKIEKMTPKNKLVDSYKEIKKIAKKVGDKEVKRGD